MQQTTSTVADRDRKYAWDYFQLHSSQRIATFNFYITLASALLAVISAVIQPSVNLFYIAPVLSLVLILLSFVFWKLDQRNKMLIRCSEEALKEIEQRLEATDLPIPAISLFRLDDLMVSTQRSHRSNLFWKRFYSYSDCFNTVFILFGLLGILGLVLGVKILIGS